MNNQNSRRTNEHNLIAEFSGMGTQPVSIPSVQQSDPSVSTTDGSSDSSSSMGDGNKIDPSSMNGTSKNSSGLFDDPQGTTCRN